MLNVAQNRLENVIQMLNLLIFDSFPKQLWLLLDGTAVFMAAYNSTLGLHESLVCISFLYLVDCHQKWLAILNIITLAI